MSSASSKVWVVDSVFEHGISCRAEQQPSVEEVLEAIAEFGRRAEGGRLRYGMRLGERERACARY